MTERPAGVSGGPGWLAVRAALGLALLVLAGVLGWALFPARTVQEEPSPRPVQSPPEPARPAAAATPAPKRAEAMPREVRIEDVGAGDGTGIHAFPRPGTKPVKIGLVVPDGFELPEGYVRHYQTTDDGRTLAPILMFHPDYRPVDAQGNPVALPADRIVPPALAPRGMPQVPLELPPSPGEAK